MWMGLDVPPMTPTAGGLELAIYPESIAEDARTREGQGSGVRSLSADRTFEPGAGDRGPSGAGRLDLFRAVPTVDPCGAARKAEADLDGVFRPCSEDVDVGADRTRQGDPAPLRRCGSML